MIQSIINGIIKAIRTEYDKSFRIYTESTEQGLIEPCFSLLCLNPSTDRQMGNRYMRYFPFMITYFPSSDEPVAECNAVCETLFGLLNDVETDIGVVHAFGTPGGKVVDGVLHFDIQYQVFAQLEVDLGDRMNELAVDTTTEQKEQVIENGKK